MNVIGVCLLLFLSFSNVYFGASSSHHSEQRILQNLISSKQVDFIDESLSSEIIADLFRFYEARGFSPVWFESGEIKSCYFDFINILEDAIFHGLFPENYFLTKIVKRYTQLSDGSLQGLTLLSQLVKLDVLLSFSLLRYIKHLINGQIDPAVFYSAWSVGDTSADYSRLLKNALIGTDFRAVLESVIPQQREYLNLTRLLKSCYGIQNRGGWPTIALGSVLDIGSWGPRVSDLKKRLIVSGELHYLNKNEPQLFDRALKDAVKRFQQKHSLFEDGIVGKGTLIQLNTSVEENIQQIIVNLERWRWFPLDFGERYVLVNTASFLLDYVEYGQRRLSMRVIVGQQYQKTPIIRSKLSYVELNPFWTIPKRLFFSQFLDRIKANPEFINKKNLRFYKGDPDHLSRVFLSKPALKRLSRKSFPYRVRQMPGPGNPMGKVKLIFPNSYDVYLHDTPSGHKFNVSERAFSSGCIRLEKPFELAYEVLKFDPAWSKARLRRSFKSWRRQLVSINQPISVYLFYWTARQTQEGEIYLLPDIYHRDAAIYDAIVANKVK